MSSAKGEAELMRVGTGVEGGSSTIFSGETHSAPNHNRSIQALPDAELDSVQRRMKSGSLALL